MRISTEYVSDDYLHLNSCGIENLNENDTNRLRAMGRKDYHILYVYHGVCYTEIDGKEVSAGEGSLILYRPNVKQRYSFKKRDNSISCYLHFTGSGCEKLVNDIFTDNKSVLYVGKSRTIKNVFEKLSGEYILKKPYWESVCAAYLLELFSVISRKIAYLREDEVNINAPVIDKVMLHMNELYGENKPLEYYAEYCKLSLGRFAHLFKDVVGMPPMEYIIGVRIDKAKELLTSTDFSVCEIAMLCGFGNQNYFSRMFKKRTGISPTKYNTK